MSQDQSTTKQGLRNLNGATLNGIVNGKRKTPKGVDYHDCSVFARSVMVDQDGATTQIRQCGVCRQLVP